MKIYIRCISDEKGLSVPIPTSKQRKIMERSNNQSLTWSQRHPESSANREMSPPCFRSGWDHSYLPPKKCKGEGIPTEDIYVCGEPNLDQADATCATGQPDATCAANAASQAEGQWTCDPAWLDQFEEMFNGSQQENPAQEPDYMDGGIVGNGTEWSGNYTNPYDERGGQSNGPYCEPTTQCIEPDNGPYCSQTGDNCFVQNDNQCLDSSDHRYFEQSEGCYDPKCSCYDSHCYTQCDHRYDVSDVQYFEQSPDHPPVPDNEQPYLPTNDNEQPYLPTNDNTRTTACPQQPCQPHNHPSFSEQSSQIAAYVDPSVPESTLYNTDQCIHTYNVINTVEDIHTPEDVLINQVHLMTIAGEITEYEESFLQQLILEKDPSVREALRRYSLGESQSLVQLLHARDDSSDLLTKKDLEYATYLAQNEPEPGPERPHGNGFEQMYASLYDERSAANIVSYTPEDAMKMTNLPPLFTVNETLCGMVLKRVTSKKIFKKWNRCVFVVKPSFLQLYRTAAEWRQQGPIYWQTNIHSYMRASPIVRKSYDNILIYTFELLENPLTNVHINAAIQGVAFSASLPIREVGVFGSAYYGIVKALHDKLEEDIRLKVEELAAEA